MGLAGSASGLPVFLEASCVASLSFPASCPDSCASRSVGSDRTATIVSQKHKQTFSLYCIFLIHLKEQNRGNIPSRYDHHVAWLKCNVFALTCYGFLVVERNAYLPAILFAGNIHGVGFCKSPQSPLPRHQLTRRHISLKHQLPS